jgi:hypothetical protein
MPNKRPRRETVTILYIKCPICNESSLVSQWSISCFDVPSYQRSVSIETELNDDSCMICPNCFKSSRYGYLIEMQKYLNS